MKKRNFLACIAAIFLISGFSIVFFTVSENAQTANPIGYILFGLGISIMMVVGASAASNDKE
ncbi:MAG: hypothetical protein Q3965_05840 [Rothia sp. (in: high G+C Gram-positive bacteria)]|nr:hypothetical protein [Rothia sp. (in: high G+C Gram-positive bacteria)]